MLGAHPPDLIWGWIIETFVILQVYIFVGVFFMLLSSCSDNAINNFVSCHVHSRGFFPINDAETL